MTNIDQADPTRCLLPCRWCGSEINNNFKYCPICHRSQGRFQGLIGPTSNWIAITAVIVTFLQLVFMIVQTNKSVDAVGKSDSVLTQIREERSRIEEIKGRVQQLEKAAQESSHSTTQALLRIQAIDLQVKDLSAKRQREIQDKTAAVENARATYLELQNKLAAIPATLDVQSPRTLMEKRCVRIVFGNRICAPESKVVLEMQTHQNPAYEQLQAQVEQASRALQEAEAELSESLTR